MNQPVVITGLGICCSIGNCVSEVVDSLRQGQSGLKEFHTHHAPNLISKFAATIDALPTGSIAEHLIDRWDRGTLLAAIAAGEALASTKLDISTISADRLALATGASGSGQFQPPSHQSMLQQAQDPLISKLVMQRNVPGFQTDELARYFGFHGPLLTITSASAGSGIAIGAALRWLQSGQADLVLAGGGEGLLPLNIIGFDFLGILDAQPCSPFSRSTGMSMGEGAGFVVLERYASAVARQAHIYGFLHGFAVTNDAFDSIQFDPSGDGIRRALRDAMQDAGMQPEDVQWIKSSGAGGASQDAAEMAAIASAFQSHRPPITSLESTLGHCNGAGPAMGLVTSLACQQAGFTPATLNFDPQVCSYDYDFVPNQPRAESFDGFVATTAAFGGTNVVLCGGKAQPRTASSFQTLNHSELDPIVISGLGLVSPLGCGQRDLAERLLEENEWLSAGTADREQDWPAIPTARVRDFDGRKLLPSFKLRGVELLTQYAAAATRFALRDAELDARAISERIGVVTGVARASGQALDKLFQALEGPWGSLAVSKALLRKGRFLVASQLAQWFALRGYTATVTDGYCSSLRALSAAVDQLRASPELDALIVVAADEVASYSLRMWQPLGILKPAGQSHWQPYGSPGQGMLPGEGAVAIVLERASSAQRRGARPLASIAAIASTFDAPKVAHDSEVSWMDADPESHWLRLALRRALERADCHAQDIDWLLGCGCGIATYDQRELQAAGEIFGHDKQVQSIAQSIGVLESAGGLMAVAAGSVRLAMAHAPGANVTTHGASITTADQPSHALIFGSSETGRNTAIILRS